MGSNAWINAASGVGLAAVMLGFVPTAGADQLEGIKGHIDIPEIARVPGGPSNLDHHIDMLELVNDDSVAGLDGWGIPNPGQDVRVTPPPAEPGMLGGSPSLGSLIVTAPDSLRPDSLISPIGTLQAVPGGATIGPIGMLAVLASRRRRR